MTTSMAFDPATASLSAQLVNVMVTLQWPAGLSEAISNYTPPQVADTPSVPANGDERFVCPEAARQLAILETGAGGIRIGEDEVSQLQTLFARQREAAAVADDLVSHAQFYSAAILFHNIAVNLHEVSGAFDYYGPWWDFCEKRHHRIAAAFLHEQAADMFALAGDYKEARGGFFQSFDLYSKVSNALHHGARDWERRSLKKALSANVGAGDFVEGARLARMLLEYETVVDLVKRELELRAQNPDRDVSRAPNSELREMMGNALFQLGRPEDAAVEMENAKAYAGDAWRKAAEYRLNRGEDSYAAFAYVRAVSAKLAIDREPSWRTLIEATLAVWGYERARAKEEAVEIKDIIAARRLLAGVLERMELFGSAIEIRESIRTNYADDSDAEAIEALRGKVRGLEMPSLANVAEDDGMTPDDGSVIDVEAKARKFYEAAGAEKVYEVAVRHMKAGYPGVALGPFKWLIENDDPTVKLSPYYRLAKEKYPFALWLDAVIGADKSMARGREAERTGKLRDAFQYYSGAGIILEKTRMENRQKVADRASGALPYEDGMEDFYADSVEAMVRVAKETNLLPAIERAPALFRAALLLSRRNVYSRYPIRRVGDLYIAAGDELKNHRDGSDETKRLAEYYLKEGFEALAANGAPIGRAART